MSEISGRILHQMLQIIYMVIVNFFSKILTKILKLHLSTTAVQQYNAFEQFEVMKPQSSLPHLQKLTIT